MVRMCVIAAIMALLAACRSDGAGTSAHSAVRATLDAQALTAEDGVRLPVHLWKPDGEVRAIVVVAHGMNDYGESFAPPARRWALSGIATYAIDQRGFGRAAERGRWYGGDRMADDLLALARLLREGNPGTPLFLLGESMGGAVAILAAGRAEPGLLNGLVLSAPAIWGSGPRAEVTYAAAMVLSTLTPSATVPPLSVNTPSTDDPDVLKRLREDTLIIHHTRLDTLAGIVALMRSARQKAASVRLPTLVLLGDLDGHVPRDGVAALLRRLPPPDGSPGTTLALYEQGRHLLMRSLNGDRVTDDVAAWMLEPGRPLPSGADVRAKGCPTLLKAPGRGCRLDQVAGMR